MMIASLTGATVLVVLAAPVAASLVIIPAARRAVCRVALLGVAAVYLVSAVILALDVARADASHAGAPAHIVLSYFRVDALGVFAFAVIALVFASAAVYSLFYLRAHPLTVRQEMLYSGAVVLFAGAMAGVVLSEHLALMWVFVEATTLASAILIYTERSKTSLEATWKYVFICSIGIAVAFVGIVVLSMGSRTVGSLRFSDLYRGADSMNPFWLKMAFVFLLVGFGTKVGVAPIHAWLPDAHSEAPSPISAMLSGGLLASAFIALVRIFRLMGAAGLGDFARVLMLATGFLSLFIAAAFLLGTHNYKRMLAYSSIENMGVLFIGICLGRTGTYAAMIHTLAHSLSKAALFLTSGNILHLYRSKRVEDVRGIVRRDPVTGWIWMVSLLAIAGIPPFPSFLSKFLIARAFLEAGATGTTGGLGLVIPWLVIPFFLLLLVIVFAMLRVTVSMAFGTSETVGAAGTQPAIVQRNSLGVAAYAPQVVLIGILSAVGVSIPPAIENMIRAAAAFLT